MTIIEYRAGTVEYIKTRLFTAIRWESEDRMIVEATLTIVKFILSGWGIEKAAHLSYSELPFSNLKQVVLILCVNLNGTQNWAQQTAKAYLTL